MKLDEIARRIHAHLRRFFDDPRINAPCETHGGTRPYYHPHAARGGAYARVVYVTYHGGTSLTRAEAAAYLAWLDAGNVGKHFTALRSGT